MNKADLNLCFDEAEKNGGNFIAIRIAMEGFPKPELIINLRENFPAKRKYYNSAYNQDGVLKSFNGIHIVSAEYGSSELIVNAVENIKFEGVEE